MTDPTNVRIPSTRMGSGNARNLQRVRRHITKGFYDETDSSGGAGGTGSGGYFYTTEKDLTANVTDSLADPAFVGQCRLLILNDANTYTWTLNNAKITSGGSEYTQVVFNADGESLTMVGIDKAGTKRWLVMANNGGVLS